MPPTTFRFDDETQRKQGARVSRMFDRIAPTYDLLNHLLSANIDVRWRTHTVKRLALTGAERCLDACTGTGDLAVALLAGGAKEVVGSDFAPEMLEIARKKAGDRARFLQADTTRLPFGAAEFDVATVGFGVRNLQNLDGGLKELCRVLRPGGRLAILEFSRPPNLIVRGLYDLYFMLILPLIGNLVSGGAENAYAYLPRSVMAFPSPSALATKLEAAGFASVTYEPLTFGIAHLHIARK
ncbi:MAG: bifunctional demethylmenaquinone methyltransferase/2-methoxy-6-polyprenyl-1,4-benzoquinol methylase UbiE [Planctomycetia bacterium]|nr:bifunctional demethylmenaquinone methyltransferase/2-methoxy-6-polyprenyl-1,4-benzoquinol methylase UbiE [Planctomycetia bacterium]